MSTTEKMTPWEKIYSLAASSYLRDAAPQFGAASSLFATEPVCRLRGRSLSITHFTCLIALVNAILVYAERWQVKFFILLTYSKFFDSVGVLASCWL
ncbi:hypothetical protein [Shewanella oneidensis]|uniref:hypothetical protein n=1 Tax=Shewanella oneidensis TaxID=70863 RepID=UPI0018729D86